MSALLAHQFEHFLFQHVVCVEYTIIAPKNRRKQLSTCSLVTGTRVNSINIESD